MNPTLTTIQANVLARKRGCTDQVMWLGLRSPTSKFGEYDDTAGLLTPDGYREFLFNTLPSHAGLAILQPGDWLWRKGIHGMHHLNLNKNANGSYENSADAKAYEWLEANLEAGLDHPDPNYRLTYPAFRQAGPMSVLRPGATMPEMIVDPNNWPWVDGHHGGLGGTTSSVLCQTWPLGIWHAARAAGYQAMDKYGQKHITLGLHLID